MSSPSCCFPGRATVDFVFLPSPSRPTTDYSLLRVFKCPKPLRTPLISLLRESKAAITAEMKVIMPLYYSLGSIIYKWLLWGSGDEIWPPITQLKTEVWRGLRSDAMSFSGDDV